MASSWENSKQHSKYHFDNFKNDSQVDKVTVLGKITGDYSDDVKQIIANKNNLTDNLKKISQLFSLESCVEQIIVQMPGDVSILQIDQLQNYLPDAPWTIMRVQIALTDWEPGHFWSYGNYNHQQWHAGDVTTFDWQNLPHCTANAGHNPRVTFQLTGIITEKTNEFLSRLKRFDSHQLELKNDSWF
jgi:hypothetical protein